jgi:hypothetical protein
MIDINNSSLQKAEQESQFISRHFYKRGYVVQPSQTLEQMAFQAGVSLLTLREINRIYRPNDQVFYATKAGDYLMIPD